MQRASRACPAQDKALAILIFRILLDDFSIEQSFHNLLISPFSDVLEAYVRWRSKEMSSCVVINTSS